MWSSISVCRRRRISVYEAGSEATGAAGSGMVDDIIGGDEAQVTRLCQENAQGEVLVPANFNAPGQIVVSGTLAACQQSGNSRIAGLEARLQAVTGTNQHRAFSRPIAQSRAEYAMTAKELEKLHLTAGCPVTQSIANVSAA